MQQTWSEDLGTVSQPLGLNHSLRQRVRRAWRAWRRRAQDRVRLARITDRELADLGTTRGQLEFNLETPIERAFRRL